MKLKKKDNKKIEIKTFKIEEYPIFCFRHLTTNKNYSFEYLKNNKDIELAKVKILDKIIELQSKNWLELGLKNKTTGYETITYNQLNFSPFNIELYKDSKLIIFRINNQNWRLIGYKSDNFKGVLHIIGFDFYYSAYKH